MPNRPEFPNHIKAASARAAAERIRGRLQAAFIETGRDLIQQKESLGHGNFLKWIDAEFSLSERSAQNLISMAKFVDSNPQHVAVLENFSARALTAIAAKETPEPVRAEVLDRAAKGEKVTERKLDTASRFCGTART